MAAKKSRPKTRRSRPAASAARRAQAESPQQERETPKQESAPDAGPWPIIGIGMSAGGLEAATQLLEALPAKPGLAAVLIPHLAPHQRSSLPSLLAQHCSVPVVEAANRMIVEVDHVYVIPPDVVMELADGGLSLTPRPPAPGQTHPVDAFLSSLAAVQGDNAIGVILSGTGSDGALGVRNIKGAGGTVIVQQPDSAKYSGMPQAAIETGLVDAVLSATEIGRKLVDLAKVGRSQQAGQPEVTISDAQFEELIQLLRTTSGVDFAHYKQPTLRRRITRRMAMHQFTDVARYITWLKAQPQEARGLYQDVLIHVTRFFREPESYVALSRLVPKLFEERRSDIPVRVWVAGCATGEEVYSVGMTIFEATADLGGEPNLQLFGTDVSDAAVEFARQGLYPASIADDVPLPKLRRFFVKTDGGYRISKTIRDRCVFARQDLTRDPPFSHLDLIVCRNVLIYMDASLQHKVMSIFHYALKSSGHLMLGQAETTGSQGDYFTLVDKKCRIYRKRAIDRTEMAPSPHHPAPHSSLLRSPAAADTGALDVKVLQHEASRVLLERYGPSGVLVNDALEIVQFRGHTGTFLEPSPGEASLNLLKLAREGLLHGVRSAMQTARKTQKPVRKEGLRVRTDGGWKEASLEVIPLAGLPVPHYLVMFDDERRPARKGPSKSAHAPAQPARARRLEEELASTREYLQSIIQEVEAANEELQSANEEILSSNEELQSTNEELDTAKEELQSTNEELNTLNEELHSRNEELTRVNGDLVNLLACVQIAIVIVSADLRIRRFTPMAEKMFNLLPADIGRPISQVNPKVDVPKLGEMISEVIDRVEPLERLVNDDEGRAFVLRIRPYKGLEGRIDGAVIALFDDSERRQTVGAEQVRKVVQTILDSSGEPLAIVDDGLRLRFVNHALCNTFGIAAPAAEGRLIYELRGDGSLIRLKSLLETVVKQNQRLDGVDIPHPASDGGQKMVTVEATPVAELEDGAVLVAFHHGAETTP